MTMPGTRQAPPPSTDLVCLPSPMGALHPRHALDLAETIDGVPTGLRTRGPSGRLTVPGTRQATPPGGERATNAFGSKAGVRFYQEVS